ncbi:molybdenum cofactor guanylyltransferase MobA [Rhodospirillum centenum]|uniref:Molybdenum cofactor guanylyltransferase n=1 Tax=Rhodospirillum centenum (strain ATCC 51521 / SW) TaxID=414684 RepID=B6IR04_RHOCS|nr:molybdenum cofactor guanylyltransferase MobA [Rhodospirillum centenum]ACI97890.1 molybdopterin-guanine dinucleotide biosynthesis protein A [Rhodospirillum centenum SW]
MRTVGVILAGGRARRLGGGDKGLVAVGGTPMLERIVARFGSQVDRLVLSANGDPGRFRSRPPLTGLPVLPDAGADGAPAAGDEDGAGPLAGILAALDWIAAQGLDATHLVSVPTDCPFLPADLVARLAAASAGAQASGAVAPRIVAVARSCPDGSGWIPPRLHPVVARWPVTLRSDLRRALYREGVRSVGAFLARCPVIPVDFAPLDVGPGGGIDPFFNVNTPDDLAAADRLAHAPDAG